MASPVCLPNCASKGGIVQLTRTAALEYAKTGIRVNAVCPGVVRTSMVDRLLAADPKAEAAFVAMEAIGRFGKPEEIADAVLWLCSERASFVTRHALVVEAGSLRLDPRPVATGAVKAAGGKPTWTRASALELFRSTS